MSIKSQNQKQVIQRSSIAVLILVLIVLVGAMTLFTKKQLTSNENSNATATKTFTSNTLGIRFSYITEDLGKEIFARQLGDKVYVYPGDIDPSAGQSVQVFSKEPVDTLQQAIKNRFLKGVDPAKCYVQSGMDVQKASPDKGVAAVIAYPISSDTNSSGLENSVNCPPGYSITNGISYFWTDKDNSTKFVFFKIGQYYIPASTSITSWHSTLEFIPTN